MVKIRDSEVIEQAEIVILGGGICGLLLALLLLQNKSAPHKINKIIILEKNSFNNSYNNKNNNFNDLSLRAINHNSKKLLQQAEIWEELSKQPYQQIELFYQQELLLQLSAKPHQQENLGYMIYGSELRQKILTKLEIYKKFKKISFYENSEAVKLQSHYPNYLILYNNYNNKNINKKILTPLIIGAEGCNSWLAQYGDFKFTGFDYSEKILVFNVKLALPIDPVLRQIFLPTGPIAFLPSHDLTQWTVLWTLPIHIAESYKALELKNFLEILKNINNININMERFLGKILAISQRETFSLACRQADFYVREGLVLLGDAAHQIHPLAGWGLNIGLADVKILSEILSQGSTISLLKRYEKQRRRHTQLLQKLIDFIHLFFQSNNLIIKTMRYKVSTVINFKAFQRLFIKIANFD